MSLSKSPFKVNELNTGSVTPSVKFETVTPSPHELSDATPGLQHASPLRLSKQLTSTRPSCVSSKSIAQRLQAEADKTQKRKKDMKRLKLQAIKHRH